MHTVTRRYKLTWFDAKLVSSKQNNLREFSPVSGVVAEP